MNMKVIASPYSSVTVKMRSDAYLKLTAFIIDLLKKEKEITLVKLLERADEVIDFPCQYESSWYTLKVKQDLEARRVIKVKRDVLNEIFPVIVLHRYKDFERTINAEGHKPL